MTDSSPTPASTKIKIWQSVCALTELKLDQPKIVEMAGKSIGIVFDGKNVHALLNYCPHAGAPVCAGAKITGYISEEPGEALNYDMSRKVIRCPWHHWEFDLQTGLPVVQSRGKLKKFDVRVIEGIVEVTV